MSIRLVTGDEKTYAEKKFDELSKMGLQKTPAIGLIKNVGAAHSVETLRWMKNTWEAVERWTIASCQPSRPTTTRRNGKIRCPRTMREPDSAEIRDEIRALFFHDNTRFPSKVEVVQQKLAEDRQTAGSSALDFGLILPPKDKYKKVLRGVRDLLPHFPLRN